MRRTMLYLPGNNPNMLVRGHLFGPDGLVLDLEDAVSMSEKDSARVLVRDMLRQGEILVSATCTKTREMFRMLESKPAGKEYEPDIGLKPYCCHFPVSNDRRDQNLLIL